MVGLQRRAGAQGFTLLVGNLAPDHINTEAKPVPAAQIELNSLIVLVFLSQPKIASMLNTGVCKFFRHAVLAPLTASNPSPGRACRESVAARRRCWRLAGIPGRPWHIARGLRSQPAHRWEGSCARHP